MKSQLVILGYVVLLLGVIITLNLLGNSFWATLAFWLLAMFLFVGGTEGIIILIASKIDDRYQEKNLPSSTVDASEVSALKRATPKQ